MFVWAILEKLDRERKLSSYQGSKTVWSKMWSYKEVSIKLTIYNYTNSNLQQKIKQKKTPQKITKKNFQSKELLHELLLKIKQRTKIRHVFTNNKSIDIRLSKAQISKKFILGGLLGKLAEMY